MNRPTARLAVASGVALTAALALGGIALAKEATPAYGNVATGTAGPSADGVANSGGDTNVHRGTDTAGDHDCPNGASGARALAPASTAAQL